MMCVTRYLHVCSHTCFSLLSLCINSINYRYNPYVLVPTHNIFWVKKRRLLISMLTKETKLKHSSDIYIHTYWNIWYPYKLNFQRQKSRESWHQPIPSINVQCSVPTLCAFDTERGVLKWPMHVAILSTAPWTVTSTQHKVTSSPLELGCKGKKN